MKVNLHQQNINIKWLIQNLYYVYLRNEFLIFDIAVLKEKLIQLVYVNHEIQ